MYPGRSRFPTPDRGNINNNSQHAPESFQSFRGLPRPLGVRLRIPQTVRRLSRPVLSLVTNHVTPVISKVASKANKYLSNDARDHNSSMQPSGQVNRLEGSNQEQEDKPEEPLSEAGFEAYLQNEYIMDDSPTTVGSNSNWGKSSDGDPDCGCGHREDDNNLAQSQVSGDDSSQAGSRNYTVATPSPLAVRNTSQSGPKKHAKFTATNIRNIPSSASFSSASSTSLADEDATYQAWLLTHGVNLPFLQTVRASDPIGFRCWMLAKGRYDKRVVKEYERHLDSIQRTSASDGRLETVEESLEAPVRQEDIYIYVDKQAKPEQQNEPDLEKTTRRDPYEELKLPPHNNPGASTEEQDKKQGGGEVEKEEVPCTFVWKSKFYQARQAAADADKSRRYGQLPQPKVVATAPPIASHVLAGSKPAVQSPASVKFRDAPSALSDLQTKEEKPPAATQKLEIKSPASTSAVVWGEMNALDDHRVPFPILKESTVKKEAGRGPAPWFKRESSGYQSPFMRQWLKVRDRMEEKRQAREKSA